MKNPIDQDIVREYLELKYPDFDLQNITQFSGGASNLTYELKGGSSSIILRKPPPGKKAKSAHNMQREYDFQKALSGFYPVPEMILHEADEEYLGSEFYLMEKVNGIIPRKEMPSNLNQNRSSIESICTNFLNHLVQLHQLDFKKIGLANFNKGPGYVERQVSGWIRRFREARTPDVPTYLKIMNWLEENQPDDLSYSVIHNDFRLDNVVFEKNEPYSILAILDWEMATIGDPMMDLGNSLAYWIEASDPSALRLFRRQPTHVNGMMNRQEVVNFYLAKTGLEVPHSEYYYYFGIFRLAVIAQQIYYRYYNRQNTNKKFAPFGTAVNLLHDYLVILLKKKELSLTSRSFGYVRNAVYQLRFVLKSMTG